MSALPPAVASYARRFHAAVPGHHVVSPLGAWLLLALLAPEAEGVAAERLPEALGMPAPEAARAASALLERPHPAVAAALGLWTMPGLGRPRYERWAQGLPAACERGAVPDQGTLDAWARDHTFGLVREFPLTVTPATVSVLASALATKVRWRMHFDVVPSDALRSPWSDRVGRVLHAPPGRHRVAVARTAAGECGVHVEVSQDGALAVVSLVGPRDAGRADVLAAAHDVALALPDHGLPGAVDVFDLAVGEADAWTVTEEEALVVGGREARVSAVLPAWSAETDVALLEAPELAFGDAGAVLVELLQPIEGSVDAKQRAVARYTASGFEAAAVTAIGMRASAPLRSPGLLRSLEVRFGRPYAVVAVARSGPQAWRGVPVFSAWVEEPAEAEEPEYSFS